MEPHDLLTRDEARQIAAEAVQLAFREMGLDIGDWQEVQKDMAFLRKQRNGSERIGKWLMMGTISCFVSGALWILWVGFKYVVKH